MEERSTDTRLIGTPGYYGQFCPQNTPFVVYLKLLLVKVKEKQPTDGERNLGKKKNDGFCCNLINLYL